VISFFYFTC